MSALTSFLAPVLSPILASHRFAQVPAGAIAADQAGILRRWCALHGRLPVGKVVHAPNADATDLAARWRAEVPVTTFESYGELLPRVWAGERDVMFPGRAAALAQTSGTTSAGIGERFIPQSRALLAHHRLGGLAALGLAVKDAGGRKLLGGGLLMIGGSTDLKPNPAGIPAGDLSGITVSLIPRVLADAYEPGLAIALDSDWPRKLQRIVQRTATRDIRLVSGIGSWLLVLFDAVCKARGVERIRDAWPGLRAVIHGGHAVEPVIPQLRFHLSPATRLVEVYPASEAFFAVGESSWSPGDDGPPPLRLLTRHGIVLEGCPEDDRPADGTRAVGAELFEPGRLYRLLVTTPGGLARYSTGDLVTGAGPGLIRFAGRTKTRISVFGEHVEGHALALALAHACQVAGASVRHYHVAPILPTPDDGHGRHEWWIEWERAPADRAAFIAAIDAWLCREVLDYGAHRTGNIQLLEPVLREVGAGTFDRWLAAKGKLGGQHKVPQAWPDRAIADGLAAAAG